MSEDRLRPLWDGIDLDATEKNLRAALAREATDSGRAEVLTQLARVESLRGHLDAASSLLDEADGLAGNDEVARARVLLERGRVVRRSDSDAAAVPLLEQAYEAALAAGQHFMAADAAHSCALAGDMVIWTRRGLEVVDSHSSAEYWRGTLLMNLGDWQWDRGETEESRSSFEAALKAREQETRYPWLTDYARYGLGRALRKLGRSTEALALLESAVEGTEEYPPDEHSALIREELAAAYDDLRRAEDAAAQRAALERERELRVPPA